MRVVAGTARGRRLAPVPAGTRPVSDRAREGLFSSLGGSVEGARVLDLYAGTGALGIEALSRGAEAATFVDRSPKAIATIRDNLGRTGLGERASVAKREVLRFLREPGTPQDLILLDPPYDTPERVLDEALALVPGWLSGAGWTVVLTRPVKGYIPVIPVSWVETRRLRYGDALVLLYQEV